MAADPRLAAHWKRLIAATLALLAAGLLLPLVAPAPALDENRPLANRPEAPTDLASLAKLRTEVDAWVADRFPPRPHLIGALNYLRLRIGVSGSSRVIVGRDGWLYLDDGTHLGAARGQPAMSDDDERRWLESLAGRGEAMRARGGAYLMLIPPDKEAAYPQYAPAWFRLDPDRAAVRLAHLAERAGVGDVVYPQAEITAAAGRGVKAYSRHDTHWTGPGAYEGYAALMRRLQAMGIGQGPRPVAAFTPLTGAARERPRNLALMLGVASFVPIDYPELGDPAAEAGLATTYLTDQVDWTKPRVIDTGQVGKPVLLMTMDSFSNALLPFLYGDFSRIVLAHNQDGAWRPDLIERFQPDVTVLEVVESGARVAMGAAPPPSAEARARIAAVLADPAARPALPARPPLTIQPRVLAPVEGGRRMRSLEGGAGPDVLEGGPDSDQMLGRAGADRLYGREGDDVMGGGRDDDLLDGGPGDDQLSGGRGRDTLTGGPGADVFTSFPDADEDVVTDFSVAQGDRIELPVGTSWRVVQRGADAVVELKGARLVLKGVRAANLPADAVRLR